jgi:O-antigen ligase
LYLYADALHIIYFNKLPLKSLFSAAFVNHNFSEPINMHATYLSMLLMLCLTWLLQQIFTGVSGKQRILFIGCSAILVAGLVQAASKSVLIASMFIVFAGFPWLVIKKTHRGRFLLTSLLLVVLLLSVLLSAAVFRNRYMTAFENDLQLHTGITKNDSRLDRWNAALELIKNAPLAGTGSGSDISLLKEIYFERKMYAAYLNNVNVHNQYLAFLIDAGIAGLLVYGCTLAWACWQSVRQRDIMLFAFTSLVVLVSFSEDLLDVNKGIFFYAFFFSFFVLRQKPAVAKYISSGRQPAARINEL